MKPVTDRVTPPVGADFKQPGKIDNLLESIWVKSEVEMSTRSSSFSHRNTTASSLSGDAIGSSGTWENERPKYKV